MSKMMLSFVILALPSLAMAQAVTPPHPFSGTIVSVQGDSITIAAKDGTNATIAMTPGWTVSANKKVDVNAIHADEFLATTNVPVDEHTGTSTEVRILEAGYRPEEGTHALSSTSPNMMTHGTVKTASKTSTGVELEITYPNGSRKLIVPANVPVIESTLLDHSVLKPGVAVGGVTRTGPDGVARASRIQLSN